MVQKLDVKYVHYYTDGSAAKKISPAFPVIHFAPPKTKQTKKIKIYVDPVAILGIIVAVSMLIMMTVGVVKLSSARRENLRLQTCVEQLTQRNEQLTLEYHDSFDLEQVEQKALQLGMVPREQVSTTTIHITLPEQPQIQTVTLWQQIGTFLSGLFA